MIHLDLTCPTHLPHVRSWNMHTARYSTPPTRARRSGECPNEVVLLCMTLCEIGLQTVAAKNPVAVHNMHRPGRQSYRHIIQLLIMF